VPFLIPFHDWCAPRGNFIVAADRANLSIRELIDGTAVRIVGGDHQVIVADWLSTMQKS
jgi:hypothetical protein